MPSDIKFKLYTDHQIEVLGSCLVTVKYEDHERKLSVLVVKGQGPCLLGRNWMSELKLNWKVIGQVEAREDIQFVIDKYSEVFEERIGHTERSNCKDTHRPTSHTSVLPHMSCSICLETEGQSRVR